MKEVVFIDGVRSAFTKLGGGLRTLAASDIAAFVVKGLLEKTQILSRTHVDGLFAGCALSDIQCFSPARYAVLASGLPIETPASFVEMQCGSAITSINHAAAKIATGLADIIIAGGMESYSTMPAFFSLTQEPYKLIPPTALPRKLAPMPEDDISMIDANELAAGKWGITREACDVFALESQQRLQNAYTSGITGSEIIPYTIPATRKTPERIINTDEHPRPDTTKIKLAELRSVKANGVTTAGNASGRNDGAAFVLMMSAEKARELGYTPLARWVTGADCGCHPREVLVAPVFSNFKAMKQAGITLDELDVIECNEAFAAQNLCVISEMESQSGKKIDMKKWNPNGGAIAIGHPNAASGARIAMFAMRHLEKTGGRYGLFSSCCGGGQGVTTIIENLRV